MDYKETEIKKCMSIKLNGFQEAINYFPMLSHQWKGRSDTQLCWKTCLLSLKTLQNSMICKEEVCHALSTQL